MHTHNSIRVIRVNTSSWFTFMTHANIACLEADVVLVCTALVLRHNEQHSIFHLQPEFTMFVIQYSFILPLEKKDGNSNWS